VSIYRQLFPLRRGPTRRLSPASRCIYCGATGAPLSEEHVVPDGLGGDLVIPEASCSECARATHRAETHLIKGLLQYPRSIVGVVSRKRKRAPRNIPVQMGSGEPRDPSHRVVDHSAPLLFPFPITDDLPGVLSGYPAGAGPAVRIGLFGQQDWLDRGRAWLGGSGQFKVGFSMHLGVAGQALAKIAHAFACAKLGTRGFEPLLTDYIRANEPPFDGHHIGIFSSDGIQPDVLHYLDVQLVPARRSSTGLILRDPVYVVFVRLFAHMPSPSVLVVVGRPVAGALAPFVSVFDHSIKEGPAKV
jgi:HNH endonuclease